MNLAEWRNDPELVRAWKDTMALPHMVTGMEILMKINLPVEVEPPKGIPHLEFLAGEEKRRQGYYEFYRNMVALGIVAPIAPVQEPEGWETPIVMPEKLT